MQKFASVEIILHDLSMGEKYKQERRIASFTLCYIGPAFHQFWMHSKYCVFVACVYNERPILCKYCFNMQKFLQEYRNIFDKISMLLKC